MRSDIIIMPLYAEDHSVISLVVSKEDGQSLTWNELADALRDYADLIDSGNPATPN